MISLVVLGVVLGLVLVADSWVYGAIGHCSLRLLSNRCGQEVILLILLTLPHIRQQSCRIEERLRILTRSIMAWLWWQLHGEVALALCCKPLTCWLINWLQVFVDQIVITILLLRMLASKTLLVQRIISKSWVWSSVAWPFHAKIVSALPSAALLQLLLRQFIGVQVNMRYCFMALVLLLNSIWIIGVIAQASLVYVAGVWHSAFALWFRSVFLQVLLLYFAYISCISGAYELWSAWCTKRRMSCFSCGSHGVNLALCPLILLLKVEASRFRRHPISIDNFHILMVLALLLLLHPTLKVRVAPRLHILSTLVIFTILICSQFRHVDSWWLRLYWFTKWFLVVVKVSVLAHF